MLGRATPVLPAEDMARAKTFYTEKIGLSMPSLDAADKGLRRLERLHAKDIVAERHGLGDVGLRHATLTNYG